MADNGRWFKLWCSSVHDPDLSNMPIADYGRWCKLGAYIKEHGSNGEITLKEPSKMVCTMLQLETLNDVFLCFQNIKNVTVTTVTTATVTYIFKYENWHKYQGDFSGDRVRKYRAKNDENVTPKKRGEEKRREENKKREEKTIKEKNKTHTTGVCFSPPSVEEVKAYCDERNNNVDPDEFVAFYKSKGWLIGKTSMKDWKSAVITWEKNDKRRRPETDDGFGFLRRDEKVKSTV